MVENIKNYLKFVTEGHPEYEEGVRETLEFLEKMRRSEKLPARDMSFEMYEVVSNPPYQHELFYFDPSSLELEVEGRVKKLPPIEARLLTTLSLNENIPLPHRHFERIIDPHISASNYKNLLAVHIRKLRQSIDAGRGLPVSPIQSIYHLGYRLRNPVQPIEVFSDK